MGKRLARSDCGGTGDDFGRRSRTGVHQHDHRHLLDGGGQLGQRVAQVSGCVEFAASIEGRLGIRQLAIGRHDNDIFGHMNNAVYFGLGQNEKGEILNDMYRWVEK